MYSKIVILGVHQGAELVETRRYDQTVIKIGQSEDADLQLKHESVNTMHAVVQVTNRVEILDLGSSHGVRLNGKPVADALLSTGDIIQIGIYRIKVYIGPGTCKTCTRKHDRTNTIASPWRDASSHS